MVGTSDKSLPQNLIEQPSSERSNMRYLKGVGLYGANASGKSTLLHALHALRKMVLTSARNTDPKEPITEIESFALCPDMENIPTAFGIVFVADKIRYEYRVAATKERIWHESLRAFPYGREQTWFARDWDTDTKVYNWEPERPTGFKRDTQLEGYTLSNMLYLSKAIASNKTELEPVFNWFRNTLVFLNEKNDNTLSPSYTLKQIEEQSDYCGNISNLLLHADLGITEIKTRDLFSKDEFITHLKQKEKIDEEKDAKIIQMLPERFTEPLLEHRGIKGQSFALPWKMESTGTQRLFALAGPWFDILKKGKVVCIDELESSMHPLMARALLQCFFDGSENSNGAQIIFTTHNPLLLDTELIRRDQIWFTEKDHYGEAHLYPLTDYSPRKNESLLRGYLSGRYGGIPFIPDNLANADMGINKVCGIGAAHAK